MLDYTENMIRDVKSALLTAMCRRKQYCIEWEDDRGTEREFIVYATGERDAIGQLFYHLAFKSKRGEGVQGVRITGVQLCNYITNGGKMVSNDGSSEFDAKYNSKYGPIPFAPQKLKDPICDFIDHQIWEREDCDEND